MSAASRVHEVVQSTLDDGEIAIAWMLTIDIAGPNGDRYLAHRAGGGADGDDPPMVWAALGMLHASVQVAEDQLRDCTEDHDDEEEEVED